MKSSFRMNRGLLSIWITCSLVVPSTLAAPPDKSGVKANVISLPKGAGSIEGLGESFEPQLNTGGSSYGVSISVPAGRAGLGPTLRLSYNSYTGNGICGIGWSFDLMSIKRQTDKGFPEYDNGDTFVSAGEELVPLNNAEQDWRCENEHSFQRFRRIDSDGDGTLDAWEITERNGTKHTLGRFRGQNGRWSTVEHPEKASAPAFDRTYCWMIDSTTDLNGNRIEYEYVRGNNVLYPSRITYGQLGENFHEVTFQYQDRPDAFDDYRPTFSARLDRRLSRIEVRTQGKLVRAYNLAYAYEPGDLTPDQAAIQSTYLDLGVTLLKRVVQVDRSGSDANFLPPLIFTYSGLDLTKGEQRGFSAPPELDLAEPNGRVQLADLDGDGLPDLFATTAEGAGKGQRVALNRGESRLSGQPKLGFAPAKLVLGSSPVDLAQPSTVVHDPKGKGLVDLSNLVEEGGNKRLETFGNRARLDVVDEDRLGFSQDNLEATILPNPPAFVTYSAAGTRQMDVNFDKRSDFVNLEPAFGAMKVNTFYIERGGQWVAGESTLPPSYPLANTFQGSDGQPNPCVHLADMNGDRMLDLVCLAPSPSANGQRIHVSYWPLCGRGRYGEERAMPNAETDTFEIGNADLRDVYIEDITGDGLADILVVDGSGPETVLTLRVNIAGQRWSPPYTRAGLPRYAPRDPAQPTIFRVVDLNGNGSLDLLFRNPAPQDTWDYIELLPRGAPSLMTGIDNGLGKRTTIVYGSAAEDEQLAREAGHPWRTFAPIPLQVVRQIRTSAGVDLNGDGKEDTMVTEFRYRDPYYDGFEREFRGFAFAQRVDYGDDLVFDPVSQLMQVSPGWDRTRTPTGQQSGPSLVQRYRFHTGAADQQDNDDYGGAAPPDRKIDEVTEIGGREEEALKGLQAVEEQVDPVVLHSAQDGGFDAGCDAASKATTPELQGKLTPDAYVYTRVRQDWILRRLYRPAEPLPYLADQDADGVLEDYRNTPAVLVPAGRFAAQGIGVLAGNGHSVTYAFVRTQTTEVYEANGLLSSALGYPHGRLARTTKTFEYDDYGNPTVVRDLGLDDPAFDDERITTTSYAHGGNALSLWVISQPDTINVTDENGAFVSKKVHYYDGEPFIGIQGQIQDRALLHRTVEHIDATHTIQASRSKFDSFGNLEETRDPIGNIRRIAYDPVLRTYPVTESMVVGGGSPDLSLEAEYDLGFGVVTQSKDFNGNLTTYQYDSFGRLVGIVRPGDSAELPTVTYSYQPGDPVRGRAFIYDATGKLTLTSVPLGSVSRTIAQQREVSGQPGQFVTASYADGSGKSLATIEEGDAQGKWVVKQATSFNLRAQPQSQWLPFEVASIEVPQFPVLWPSGRPPAQGGTNPIVATDLYYDPTGRPIRTVAPPEVWGGERRETATQNLPFQTWTLDEEDLRAGSPYAGTPHIAYSDGLGRVIAVTEVVKLDDQGRQAAVTNHWTTHYEYDLNDRLTRVQDAQNNVKVMRYDGLKRKIFMNDPDQGISTYAYDDASNLTETTDAKGQRITYTYDGVNRILTEEYHDETSPEFSYNRTPDVAYFYDQPPGSVDQGDGTRATARNTRGLLTAVVDNSGEEHTSYDARGRVEWTIKRLPDPALRSQPNLQASSFVSYTTHFEYDDLDHVTRMRYPDNDEVGYEYSSRSLLQRIVGGPTGNIISAIHYAPSAQHLQIEYGNGVRTTYVYDPRLRLTDLLTVSDPSKARRELVNFHYDFDGVSNVKAIRDQRDASALALADPRRNSQTFTYDDLYRLTRVQYNLPTPSPANGGEIDYRYDRIGNMLAQTSDIAHFEQGLSLTDVGAMAYGGASGPSDHVGRGTNNAAGPHALTGISHPKLGARNLQYDANGNTTHLDGMTCTWDFKDRLVAIEDDTMRAEYSYDYTDRRVSKYVTLKPSPSPDQTDREDQAGSTLYVNKYFEIRLHDQPVKYVFNGATRVAQITGSLSPSTRIQRLRFSAGWNLCSLAVTATNALGQMSNFAVLGSQSVFRWNQPTVAWVPILPNETVAAGSILWLYTTAPATIALSGAYEEPGNKPISAGGSFYASTGLEAWNIRSALEAQPATAAWYFNPSGQDWEISLPLFTNTVVNFPQILSPGSAFFAQAGAATELETPDAALRIRYYHQDHLGSSSVITDAEGLPVEETAFYPFGSPRNEYQPRQAEEHYRFSQKERDAESRLLYFETRYLSGALPRFVTADAKYANCDLLSKEELAAYVGQPQKLNLYAYCKNNPIIFYDPDGRDTATAVGVQVEGSFGVSGSAEVSAAVFSPDSGDWYKPWKYDVGICLSTGVGAGSPGASASVNASFNLGGRDSFEGKTVSVGVSGGEGVVGSASISQGTGQPTYSVGGGLGVGPPVGATIKRSNTSCVTVKDVVGTITSAFSSPVQSQVPNIELRSSPEELPTSWRSVAFEDPPPPPRPQPKQSPPPPRRQPREKQECWTRGVPP